MTTTKDFTPWQDYKPTFHAVETLPVFQQREIWWCSIGVNIGHEMDGKNQFSTRPVLVLRKFNAHLFWGIPLTTQIKANPYYVSFRFKEKEQCAMISQLRLWDARRLRNPMGKLAEEEFDRIRSIVKDLI